MLSSTTSPGHRADGSEGAKTCGTIGARCPEEIYVQHWTLYMLCFTILLPQIQLLMQFQMESDTNCMFSSQHFLRGWYLTVRYALGMSRQGVNAHSHRPSPWKFPCFFKKWWAIIQKSIYSLVSHNCWKHCNKLTYVCMCINHLQIMNMYQISIHVIMYMYIFFKLYDMQVYSSVTISLYSLLLQAFSLFACDYWLWEKYVLGMSRHEVNIHLT